MCWYQEQRLYTVGVRGPDCSLQSRHSPAPSHEWNAFDAVSCQDTEDAQLHSRSRRSSRCKFNKIFQNSTTMTPKRKPAGQQTKEELAEKVNFFLEKYVSLCEKNWWSEWLKPTLLYYRSGLTSASGLLQLWRLPGICPISDKLTKTTSCCINVVFIRLQNLHFTQSLVSLQV